MISIHVDDLKIVKVVGIPVTRTTTLFISMNTKKGNTSRNQKMEISPVIAVGVWIYAIKTNSYLYLMRNDHKHYGLWGLPGGKIEKGETILGAIARECQEELGLIPEAIRLIPLEKFTTDDEKFTYHTFFCSVPTEFCPILNDEHIGWAWVQSGRWPKPMHAGLWATVNFDTVRNKIKQLEKISASPRVLQ